MNEPLKLLIVDDSMLMRQAISAIFEKDDMVQVVGQAADGREALELAEKLEPDIITLDINMPVMDGLTALKHLMIKNPRRVLVLSSHTHEGSKISFDALRYGAIDFIIKPSRLESSDPDEFASIMRRKVKNVAEVKLSSMKYIRVSQNTNPGSIDGETPDSIVVMGAAEGGYAPLLKIIPALRNDVKATYAVVLYADSIHVDAFIDYLNECSAITVKRTAQNEVMKSGVCYISSGSDYTTIHKQGDDYIFHVSPSPFDFRKGSIDMLLFSAADEFTTNSIGVLLSGMGSDGKEGMEEFSRVNGQVILRDPSNCLYKEMVETSMHHSMPENIVTDDKIIDRINALLLAG